MSKQLKKCIAILMCIAFAFAFSSCGSESNETADNSKTISFTDDCGRTVEIPENITRVAPAGAVAQMVIMTVNPKCLVGLANEVDSNQEAYLPDYFNELPVFGQFYGSNPNLNKEALLAADPQVIIDIGDMKESQKEDMDSIQEQTGMPVIFIDTSLDRFPNAYRTLGSLLGKEDKGNELADYVENTIETAKANAAEIKDRKTVYYGGGPEGLNCNAKGSVHADVIDIIGAENAVVVDKVNHAGGGNLVNLEELYSIDPDVILINDEGAYDTVVNSPEWARLNAVKEGIVYEIPGKPYCWMSAPPSVNRILGIWWLGNLVYPEIYDYDMTEKTIEYYKLFFDYDMSVEQAGQLLANSTLK